MLKNTEILMCPKCKAEISVKDQNTAVCSENGHEFEITNGVPDFTQVSTFGERETQRVFGAEWETFLEYEADNLEKMSDGMGDDFFRNKSILEIGCGAGRHTQRLVENLGCSQITSIDLSNAVYVASKRGIDPKKTNFIKANVLALPLKPDIVDVGFSLGVLMHTENPKQSFLEMCKRVKTGGSAVIWVYKWTIRKQLMEIPRALTKNAPTIIQKTLATLLSIIFWPFVLLSKYLHITLGDHFREYAKYSFYVYKTDWFDRIGAPLINFYTEEQIEEWFKEAGFSEVEVMSYGSFFVRGIGRNKK